MKSVKIIFSLLLLPCYGITQDTTISISPVMADSHAIPLGNLDGWIFRKGNNPEWAKTDFPITGWEKLKPVDLSEKLADKKGRLEGWLRLKILLDTAFLEKMPDLQFNGWAASEIYVDGDLLNSFGNTGVNGKPFTEYNPVFQLPVTFNVQKGVAHVLAIHFVDFRSPLPPYHLKSQDRLNRFLSITTPEYRTSRYNYLMDLRFYSTMWVTVSMILTLLFWLLAFLNQTEKNLRFIAFCSTILTLLIYCESYVAPDTSYFAYSLSTLVLPLLRSSAMITGILIMLRIFERSITLPVKIVVAILFAIGIVQLFYPSNITITFQAVLILVVYAYYFVTSWKTLKGAQWAILTGILTGVLFGMTLSLLPSLNSGPDFRLNALLTSGLYLSVPLAYLVYVTMRFNEIIRDVRNNAQKVVQLSDEKREQALNQQKILQEEVKRQTAEIRTSLDNLKAAQSQLIQSEKMASLGELTAGIAHEIQNPLNFVNNFSEVSRELIEELKSQKEKLKREEQEEILNDIDVNLEKINHHGKRADAIVKGMLQHSRSGTGQKEPTNINVLADEYLRLAYHGLRAKDKSFNIMLKTDFDNTIGTINIIPQDLGRVLLNLYNNAFYAMIEKKKSAFSAPADPADEVTDSYEPVISVTTKKTGDRILISVADNGTGIPQKIADKIFQPFFTTKPTGQGTGLGLSLAYDIVKAHGGEIKVESKEGAGSVFFVHLNWSDGDRQTSG